MLERSKLWAKIGDKVRTPKGPNQAKQWVKTGQADVAIVYRTCLMESYEPDKPPVPESDLTVAATIPQKLYDPIYVGAVPIKGSRHPAVAQRFLSFLATPEARKVWIKWGFEPAR